MNLYEAKMLFSELKDMGFKVVLLTNASYKMGKDFYEELKADDCIARANKPETVNFDRLMERYHLDKSQMAHVGNSMRDDVYGGNCAGVTTCLVRRNGYLMKLGKFAKKQMGIRSKGHLIRKELLKYDIWRKHHKYIKNDQYYQLGEEPGYRKHDAGNIKF